MKRAAQTEHRKLLLLAVLLTSASTAVAQNVCDDSGCDAISSCSTCPIGDAATVGSSVATPDARLFARDHDESELTFSEAAAESSNRELLTQPSLSTSDEFAPQLAFSEQSAAFGGRRFSIPNQIGDNFGSTGNRYCLTRTFTLGNVSGFSTIGAGGGTILFEAGNDTVPNDFSSVGVPFDSNGDQIVDAVRISAPNPGANLPGLPAPFSFDDSNAIATVGDPPIGTGVNGFDVEYQYKAVIVLPDPGAGGAVVGRMKIAENSNPLPQCRVYFNYSHFDSVPFAPRGVDVNRYSPGFERTFAGGLMSYEIRFPFAATLDSNITLDGPTELSNLEFGNLFLATKALLVQTRHSILSAGVALTLPTADDTVVRLGGAPLLRVENESVHVMPFLGWGHRQDRFFSTAFLQLDFDANGNTVLFDADGTGLARSGVVQDEAYLYFDVAFGYWLWQENGRFRHLTGVAPVVELHWNRSLEGTDFIERDGYRLGEAREATQILNCVIGSYFQLGERADLTLGFTTPVGNGSDQQFDGELRVMFNRYF